MLIDVTMPIRAGAVFRLGTPPVEIATRTFHHESEGGFETVVLSLPAHTATHVDLVSKERFVRPERMIGRGHLIDVTSAVGREIQLDSIEALPVVQSGDFVLFRTDWSELAGTERYHEHPQLSLEVVKWLVATRVNAVGIDAPGLGRGRRHTEFDKLLADKDILVIENLANLRAVRQTEFTVYCLPLSIERVDAIPARVLVELPENP